MECAKGPQPLNPADIEALRIYADGYSPVEIAVQSSMRVEQVRLHLGKVKDHLLAHGVEVNSKQDLVQHARARGLLPS
ncbi:helix-turn-helix transcriptional regulator [Homoserinimonas sp. OAct 916]|uniref:helix-turn-helix transcriptional regulator n=1 Tax=Homoserinimonas sp. OAct 916 TaxID=2211450 RepID=UPI000DBE5CBA|nr:helix-turn-helix transcriptional regulator [Homoserinimonas sp. OAct 916]